MVKLNLRSLLNDKRMTQSQLASITKIRPSTICDICNNSSSFLKLDNIDKICKALDCSVQDLITFYHD